MSDVIKNPNRKINLTLEKRSKYIPEYVKLGMVPEELYFNDDEKRKLDFKMEAQNNSNAKNKKTTSLPPQMKVSSGDNQEHLWMPQAQYFNEPTATQPDPDWDGNLDNTKLDEKETQLSTEEISYNDVPELTLPSTAPKPGLEPISLELNWSDVEAGKYCICIENKLMQVVDNLIAAEEIVDDLVFNQSEIDLTTISVFKKLRLKAGIVLGE